MKNFVLGALLSASVMLGVTPDQERVLDHMEIVHLDDGQGGTVETLRIKGVNVQIVNDTGNTETINGLGNLIVGYNEPRTSGNDRTGSHSIVIGKENNYSQSVGLVCGITNSIEHQYTCAIGRGNTALAQYSTAIGGANNTAFGNESSVFGGELNASGGTYAVIFGGKLNIADRLHAICVGGDSNTIDSEYSTILGGMNNAIVTSNSNDHATITGGENNTVFTLGAKAVIGGGLNRSVSGPHDWIAGSLFEDN